ncbi:MAG: hypothetical protein PF488_02615 [Patescibacteria group bacterium]|jgi:hypothetical protein|nr:hypothetical protein [Patescibacteria group bacterium]
MNNTELNELKKEYKNVPEKLGENVGEKVGENVPENRAALVYQLMKTI